MSIGKVLIISTCYIIGYLLVSDFILNNGHICKAAFISSLVPHLNQIQQKQLLKAVYLFHKKKMNTCK